MKQPQHKKFINPTLDSDSEGDSSPNQLKIKKDPRKSLKRNSVMFTGYSEVSNIQQMNKQRKSTEQHKGSIKAPQHRYIGNQRKFSSGMRKLQFQKQKP